MKEAIICEACLSSSFGKTHTAVEGCLLKPLNMWGRHAEAHAKDSIEPVQSSGESKTPAKASPSSPLDSKERTQQEIWQNILTLMLEVDEAKEVLKQWRTKSLLSKLPKPPEMSKTLLNISGKKYATGFMTGYSAALQDIKKGLK